MLVQSRDISRDIKVLNASNVKIFTLDIITYTKMLTYLKRLKNNCALGPDRTCSENLKYAESESFYHRLNCILNIYFKFGIVPTLSRNGTLVLIPKSKPGIDTSEPKNWRPIRPII